MGSGQNGEQRMTQLQEFSTIAKSIIDSNLYMVIGTADETGIPWMAPVYYSPARYTEFYWISSAEARHSHNLTVRPQVSIVIFNSQAPIGTGQAVYMSAVAKEVASVDLNQGIAIYNERFANPVERGIHVIKGEELLPPAFYRLYRAIVSEHWILDPTPGRTGDHRIRVSVEARTETEFRASLFLVSLSPLPSPKEHRRSGNSR